jgi:hypothetical protein
MQDAAQEIEQVRHQDGRFVKGISGNPQGSISKAEQARRVAEMAESLAVEFGGLSALSPAERLLIEGAAELALMPIRRRPFVETEAVRVRVRNSIQRSLSIVRKGRRKLTRFAR